ncbi:MAG: hypothetical protein K8Q99_01455 [Acholeplasmataceae bacterium]|nr:hypothetical protein [Acholeplasmataceae bacterium]
MNPRTNENLKLENDALFLDLSKFLESTINGLETCTSFSEDDLCITQNVYFNAAVMVKTENDQLFIEFFKDSKPNDSVGNDQDKRVTMLYMNIVDDQLYFEYVRSIKKISEIMNMDTIYFNSYYESNKSIELSIDQNSNSKYQYREIDIEKGKRIYVSNNRDFSVEYYNQEMSKLFRLYLDQDREILVNTIEYHMPLSNLVYIDSLGQDNLIFLEWDLKEVNGWDQIDTSMAGTLIKDGQQVLGDYVLHVIKNGSNEAYISAMITEEEFTTNLLDLSAFGLFFDAISMEQLLEDSTYLEENYIDILEDFGFIGDLDEQYEFLETMIPFMLDSENSEEIFTILEQED